MEKLRFKYESISRWIDSADTKAQIFIGIELFIIGFILEKSFSWNHFYFFRILPIAFLLISGLALYSLYKVIRARLSNERSGSKIYFRDIAKNSEINIKETKDSILSEKEDDFLSDFTDQIIALAKVCNDKYEYLKDAEKLMIGSFILGILLYLLNVN